MAYTGTLTDDFNGPSLNFGLWKRWSTGKLSLSNISQTSGQLQVNISFPEPLNLWDSFAGGVKSKFLLAGDFDMQVDFSLLTWPYHDGLKVQLAAYLPPVIADVERIGSSAGNIDRFVTNLLGNISTIYPGLSSDSALSGTMRLVRTGNQVTGFYMDPATSGNWVQIGTYTSPSLAIAMPVYLSVFSTASGDGFQGVPALVAFDNFRVQYTKVIWQRPVPFLPLLLLD